MERLYHRLRRYSGLGVAGLILLGNYGLNNPQLGRIAERFNLPLHQEQTTRLDKKTLYLDVLVMVDDSFGKWLDSLKNEGIYLFEVRSGPGVDPARAERRVYVSSSNPGGLVTQVIHDQITAASKIYDNPDLEKRLGRKLGLRVRGISKWDFDKERYNIGGVYDVKGILTEMRKKFDNYPDDLIQAFTGLELVDKVEISQGIFMTRSTAGAALFGEKFSIVSPDIFTIPYINGRKAAHEIGHNLGAKHLTVEGYLMSPEEKDSIQFHPRTFEEMTKHVKIAYKGKF